MKVVILILHIVSAILFGICAVNVTSMTAKILYTISCAIWSVCVGMDIVNVIEDN